MGSRRRRRRTPRPAPGRRPGRCRRAPARRRGAGSGPYPRRRTRRGGRAVALPVSVSTSTTATCAPNGNVGPGATNGPSASSADHAPFSCEAGQLAPRRSHAPASRRRGTGSARGRGRRRRRWPRAGRPRARGPRSATSALIFCTAAPPCCSDRDPNVPVPTGTRSVSPCTTSMRSIGMPELLGRDHRPGRVVTLTVGRRAREHRRRPVAVDHDARNLLGLRTRERRAGDFDVAADTDTELHHVAAFAAAPLLAREASRSPAATSTMSSAPA